MTEYIISVMAATALVALGGLVTYGGKTERVSRAAMAVVLLFVVTVPIFSATGGISDLFSSDFFEELKVECDSGDTLFYENTVAAFCDGVERLVCREHGLEGDNVQVSVRALDVESMRAERIIIVLRGRAVSADARLIAETVMDAGLGECEVKIDLGR